MPEIRRGVKDIRLIQIRNDSSAPIRGVELRAVTADPKTITAAWRLFRAGEVSAEIPPWTKRWDAVPPSTLTGTAVRVGIHGAQQDSEGPRLEWRPLPPPFAPDLGLLH